MKYWELIKISTFLRKIGKFNGRNFETKNSNSRKRLNIYQQENRRIKYSLPKGKIKPWKRGRKIGIVFGKHGLGRYRNTGYIGKKSVLYERQGIFVKKFKDRKSLNGKKWNRKFVNGFLFENYRRKQQEFTRKNRISRRPNLRTLKGKP